MSFFKDFKADFTQAVNELMPDSNEVYEDEAINELLEADKKTSEDQKDKGKSKNSTSKKSTKKSTTKSKKSKPSKGLLPDDLLSDLELDEQLDDIDDVAPEDMLDHIDDLIDKELYGETESSDFMFDDDMEVNTMDTSVDDLIKQLSNGDFDGSSVEPMEQEEERNVVGSENLNSALIDEINASENEGIIDDPATGQNVPEDASDKFSFGNIDDLQEDTMSETYSEENPVDETLTGDISEEAQVEDASLNDSPIEETSIEENSIEENSIEENSIEETPLEDASIEDVPLEETPIEEASIEEASIEEASIEETPIEEASIEETSIEETSIEETSIEETPSEEVSIEETMIEETMIEETMIEETPLEDTSMEETPIDEAPIDEATMDEVLTDDDPKKEMINDASVLENISYENSITEDDSMEDNNIENNTENNIENNIEENLPEDKINISKSTESKKYNASDVDTETTYITKGTVINGDLETDGSIDIIGVVNGNVTSKGKVVVGGSVTGNIIAGEIYANGAKIEGDIKSYSSVKVGVGTMIVGSIEGESAVIAGAVNGELDVKGPVIVDSTAVIMGNIKSRSVQINNGAVIEGFCSQSYSDIDVKSFFA